MNPVLRFICCCKSPDEDEEQYLVINQDQEDGDATFPQNHVHASDGSSANLHPVGNRLSPPDEAAAPQKTTEQEEEDLLNKILHRAQESIIDVSHIEENNSDLDVAQRARAYTEAIRKHDAKIKVTDPDQNNLFGYLIDDSNGYAIQKANEASIAVHDSTEVVHYSEVFDQIVKMTMKLKPSETLVAFIVTGLIRGGQLKWEDRPLWYDVYVSAPPHDEPTWNIRMPKRDVPVQQLLFDEDAHRSRPSIPATNREEREVADAKPPPIENLSLF
ncbi:Ribosomal protein S23 domain containing protein [Aphelenchoides fujianensis]|nr:Ribosomal protein S23 domain containing protein [Aphelenchoides fujianensis]